MASASSGVITALSIKSTWNKEKRTTAHSSLEKHSTRIPHNHFRQHRLLSCSGIKTLRANRLCSRWTTLRLHDPVGYLILYQAHCYGSTFGFHLLLPGKHCIKWVSVGWREHNHTGSSSCNPDSNKVSVATLFRTKLDDTIYISKLHRKQESWQHFTPWLFWSEIVLLL